MSIQAQEYEPIELFQKSKKEIIKVNAQDDTVLDLNTNALKATKKYDHITIDLPINIKRERERERILHP